MFNVKPRYVSAARGLLPLLTAYGLTAVQPLLYAQNCTGSGNPCVTTAQYNNQRNGWNSNETGLTSDNVDTSSTGKLSQQAILQVDPTCSGCSADMPTIKIPSQSTSGAATFNPIYSQPLYVPGMTVSNPLDPNETCNPCNMVIAVTMNDTIFAWDGGVSPYRQLYAVVVYTGH